jgi:hypothetical protein
LGMNGQTQILCFARKNKPRKPRRKLLALNL